MNGNGEIMSENDVSSIASVANPIVHKGPHVEGRDIRPEEVDKNMLLDALKQKHEREREADREFLGMYDLGHDPKKLSNLQQDLDKINNELTRHKNELYEQRKELQSNSRPLGAPMPPARTLRGEKIKLNREQIHEDLQRMRLNWGMKTPTEIELKDKIETIKRSLVEEREKMFDKRELDEVVEEIEKEGALSTKYGIDTDRNVLSKSEGTAFQGEIGNNEYTVKYINEISARTKAEVWFHSTNHLGRMIEGGGLGTISNLEINDPEYYKHLREHSWTHGSPNKDATQTARLHQNDVDKIYFTIAGFEDGLGYGPSIIAFAPEDIMLDTGLYFNPDGSQNRSERVVSDVVDAAKDRLPENGSSNLQISFDRAYIAVRRIDYRNYVKQFLLAGYSQEWIEEHVFSYRGGQEGRNAAEHEIKRRIELERETKGKVEMHAVPNADKKQGIPKVWQISSKQTVNLVDNAPEVPMEENERPLKISFTRDDLNAVLNDPNHTPQDILNLLDKDFGGILDSPVGVWEGYKLREHTLMKMNQTRKYFYDKPLPGGVDSRLMEVVDAFHDMGKPKAVDEYKQDKHHEYTVEILDSVMHQLDYEESEISLAKALIKGEAIGEYLKSGNLQNSVDKIKVAQVESGLNPKDFWNLLKIYYMTDAGSYTEDAGGLKSLDYLFEFDHENNTMDFSETTKQKVLALEQAVLAA